MEYCAKCNWRVLNCKTVTLWFWWINQVPLIIFSGFTDNVRPPAHIRSWDNGPTFHKNREHWESCWLTDCSINLPMARRVRTGGLYRRKYPSQKTENSLASSINPQHKKLNYEDRITNTATMSESRKEEQKKGRHCVWWRNIAAFAPGTYLPKIHITMLHGLRNKFNGYVIWVTMIFLSIACYFSLYCSRQTVCFQNSVTSG